MSDEKRDLVLQDNELFVYNVPCNIDAKYIESLFERYGPIKEIAILCKLDDNGNQITMKTKAAWVRFSAMMGARQAYARGRDLNILGHDLYLVCGCLLNYESSDSSSSDQEISETPHFVSSDSSSSEYCEEYNAKLTGVYLHRNGSNDVLLETLYGEKWNSKRVKIKPLYITIKAKRAKASAQTAQMKLMFKNKRSYQKHKGGVKAFYRKR